MQQITIGFSIHRPEMIGLTAELMHCNDVIVLEEPPAEEFQQMLQGGLCVDDYLLTVELEYPEFSRRMCALLRELHQIGKKIIQVEPFMHNLFTIHTFFSDGHRPEELQSDKLLYPVYQVERNATKTLLDYYQVVMDGSFENAIEAILTFARDDANRFRLRDTLRARALAKLLAQYESVFVEAGTMHVALVPLLRRRVGKAVRIRPVFLAQCALKVMGETGRLLGPGDQLTLGYIFHPNIENTSREALLAARSLIYSKLIEKEELPPGRKDFPHVRDELTVIRTVARLSVKDCGRLFPLIRRLRSPHARQFVRDYLNRYKSARAMS